MRVLVVDDSALMRNLLSDMLNAESNIEVIATAKDGQDAIEKVAKLNPDVVTLDIEMPKMDGLTALKHIMNSNPTPVVMLSALTEYGSKSAIKALEYGAIDFIHKPSGSISLDLRKVREELLIKLRVASMAKLHKPKLESVKPIKHQINNRRRLIAIGASTGGPSALIEIIPRFPEDSPPILIVQHMPSGFTKSFAERLDSESAIVVKEAIEGEKIEAGKAFLAPGDHHMIVTGDKKIHLNKEPPIKWVRPAVDPMMISVASVYKSDVIGVILTGMGSDGTDGMTAIKENNGQTLAQTESSCVVYGMPNAAVKAGCVDKIVSLSQMPIEILRRC